MDIFKKLDKLIGAEVSCGKVYETYEEFIVEYITYFCIYSSEDFIQNIIEQLKKELERNYK